MEITIKQIVSAITEMPKEKQINFAKEVNRLIENDSGGNIGELSVTEIRNEIQQRYELECPHCKSGNIKGYGKYREHNRYMCKDCKKTFNDMTGTAISKIHKKEKFVKYIECISERLSLRKSAEKIQISLQTSFDWRHKITRAFIDVGCQKLEGIIKGDETFFLYSEKGSKSMEGREPRKRGGKSSKRGNSNDQVIVMTGSDRERHNMLEVVGTGRISKEEVEKSLGKSINYDKIQAFCSDGNATFSGFANNHNIKHVILDASKKQFVKEKIYHIQNVNNLHSKLKEWIRKYHGVATKYLQNYLNWFRIEDLLKNDIQATKKLLEFALTSNMTYITGKELKQQNFRT